MFEATTLIKVAVYSTALSSGRLDNIPAKLKAQAMVLLLLRLFFKAVF